MPEATPGRSDAIEGLITIVVNSTETTFRARTAIGSGWIDAVDTSGSPHLNRSMSIKLNLRGWDVHEIPRAEVNRWLPCRRLLAALPAVAQISPQGKNSRFLQSSLPGLEATVWASEPEMVNPTNIDIDERGRIWVCEGANYRAFKTRDEGDRILILEDANHTGHCDTVKVFVQDTKLQSPLGICKIGNKLYVAQSPNVMVYTIDEATDKPVGEPEILFTGFGGVNHDHGVHAAVFGPDGRIYFNCGNESTAQR